MKLTDYRVKAIRPRGERFEVSDGHGLSLRVMPTGAKSFIFRYRFDGLPKRLTLGVYDPGLAGRGDPQPGTIPYVNLAQARKLHAEARAALGQGIDPALERKEAQEERKASPTFGEFLEEFWQIELKDKKSGKERLRLLSKDFMPAWEHRKVSDITRREIVLALDKIRNRGNVVANRVRGVLARFFRFAIERGVVEFSPVDHIRSTPEKSRERALNDAEIKTFWNWMEKDKGIMYPQTKGALKLILLTGARPGEVCGMRWDEISKDVWTIPAERTKTQEENTIPLLPIAEAVIMDRRLELSESPFIFSSSYRKSEPITVRSLSRAINRNRAEIGVSDFTPHDLRRTMRTKLAEIGIEDHVAERMLGHKLQGMMGIYNRHGYDIEKREALEKWEGRLKEIVGHE